MIAPQEVALEQLEQRLEAALNVAGGRLALLTARRRPDGDLALLTLVVYPRHEACFDLWESPLGPGVREVPSLTVKLTQAHWFERALHDFFGIRPVGHPRFKSLILHEAWPQGFHPLADPTLREGPPREYAFLEVKGDGVYEIPVGPVHAGIIEPGHFRFSCLGEVIENLEIRLGYQHRGVEEQMPRIPWRRARFLAEAASSDTAVGNALAHARAIEEVLEIAPPPRARHLRIAALEIERIACHVGDLSGICGDIGYAGGAAVFGRLRGRALGLGERLTGARFLTGFVRPGGVAFDVPDALRDDVLREAAGLRAEFEGAAPLLMDNPGAVDRMRGTGRLRPTLAASFGIVGPAGRASGIAYDARRFTRPDLYHALGLKVPVYRDGDVMARTQVRVDEIRESLRLVEAALKGMPGGAVQERLPDALPADRAGVGFVEAWRGELIHLVMTDGAGGIARYALKDPSFNNWTALAIAARGQLVPDFPLCNKSFSLSYSGNDL